MRKRVDPRSIVLSTSKKAMRPEKVPEAGPKVDGEVDPGLGWLSGRVT
jgi:hypothetical protein